MMENLRIFNLQNGLTTKFADLQFADQSKEICKLALVSKKFSDFRLRIEPKNLRI
jgi:hypothetical protein